MAHTFDPSIWEADFWVWGQPGLQSKVQDSQGYKEKPCLKTNKQTKNKKQNHSEIQNQDLLGQKFREKKSVYAPMNMVCLTIKMSECEWPVNIMKPRKEKMREMGRM